MEYYWALKYGDYKDLKTVMIPPASVQVVKKRWDNGDPIHTTNGSIPANQIREFEISERLFTTQPLLEASAQAFNEPLTTPDGAIQARWVKKNVSQNKWERHYSAILGYKYLGEFGGMATIAFRVAVHDINPAITPYCTTDEIRQLTSN